MATLRCFLRSREMLSQAKPESEATGCFPPIREAGEVLAGLPSGHVKGRVCAW